MNGSHEILFLNTDGGHEYPQSMVCTISRRLNYSVSLKDRRKLQEWSSALPKSGDDAQEARPNLTGLIPTKRGVASRSKR